MKNKRTDCKEAFAMRLKELMQNNNFTQTVVATKIDCSVSSVSKWLNLLREPTLSHIWSLADLFNCSVDVLVGKRPLHK